MRRRLTLALVATALGSLGLVAIGVVATARIGARAEAEQALVERLGSLAELVNDSPRTAGNGPGEIGRLLARTQQAFGVDDLRLVEVDDATGEMVEIRRRQGPTPIAVEPLGPQQQSAFAQGEVVVLDGGGPSVTGLVRLADSQLGLMLDQPVGRIPSAVTGWFLVSAAVVLAAATALAAWLAGRFVAPIRAIERTTNALASGDLEARVPTNGGPEELVQLASSVNAMADDLERSRAAEQQFLLSVSHDLRTPLAVITGYAEGLSDGAFEDPTATGTVIESHARRLGRLVDDLLDLAKLDTNQFSLRPQSLDVSVAAGRVTAGMQGQADDDGISLSFEGTPTVALVDPDRIDQVIGNLIDNALKFATRHVTVTVTPSPTPCITVADDGAGIDPADQRYVFDRLYQSTAAPRRAESASGMGLAIVKQLVEAMGGSVSLRSGPSGTAISVSLIGADQ